MIVLDSSAAVELLLDTTTGASVADRVEAERWHVPAHFDVEVAGAVRHLVRRGEISDRDGLVAVRDLDRLPARRWPPRPLLGRSTELRHTHATADAVFVALAEALAAVLVTCDARLARSHGHAAEIDLVQ